MAKIKSIIRTDNATGRVVDAVITVPTQVISVTPIPRTIGLGDLAAAFAQPVAAIIDTVTEHMLSEQHKTELTKCPACARRRNKLNLLCPDIERCPVLEQVLGLLTIGVRNKLLEAVRRTGPRPG